ncbi:MAG: hypothetical protein P8K77_08875 [Polaribacter sp.]|nr:hypothetical protein [Polaribacter sp.]
MITELEQKQLKLLFKNHYADDVLTILNNQHIYNRNGQPHNVRYIRMVFQRVRKNSDIEAAIWQLATQRKEQLEIQRLQKQKILNRTI